MPRPGFRSLVLTVATLFAIMVTTDALYDSQQQLSLINAPSLKIHVSFNRASLQLHRQSSFDVFAAPVVSANGSLVIYDGYATFVDDGTTFTYSYVQGVGYLSRSNGETEHVQCISSEMLPFNTILPALNEMTPISSASIGDEMVECTGGNLFKTTFGGAPFALCAAGPSGFVASSSDLTVKVEYLAKPVRVKVPALSGGLSCDVVATAISMAPIALSLLNGNIVPASITRQLKAIEHMQMEPSSCACKTPLRPCVFFHGIGIRKEMEELQDTPRKISGRMGNMNRRSACCSVVKYAVLNTMDNTWLSDSLQQKFCDRALRMSETSDKKHGVIRDTVLVTHSMAGLVMAMALATGKCKFGKGTSWVASSAPMMGSMASDYFQNYCENKKAVITTGLLEIFDQCPLPQARQSLVYQNGQHATKKLKAAYKAAQKAYKDNVFAAMCSDSPHGVISQYEGIMIFAGEVIPHESAQNDGLVEFQSCAKSLDVSKFSRSYRSRFYRPELNHADTAFLTHDAFFKDSQKPMKWFECLL